jgi:hypothetical protein
VKLPAGFDRDEGGLYRILPNGRRTRHRWVLQWNDRRTGAYREASLDRTLLHKSKNAFAVALEDLGIECDSDIFTHCSLRVFFQNLNLTRTT